MGKMKAAIIGCGGIHKKHSAALHAIEETELAAVCDVVPEKAEASAAANQAKVCGFDEILADPEIRAVHICTPHYLHADMAIRMMEAGKAVLLEKPVGMNSAEAERVVRTQIRTGAHFGVCCQNRYRPVIQKLREFMQDERTGRVLGGRAFITWNRNDAYYLRDAWRGNWKYEGGGVLINQTIHTLDLIQWLFGGIKSVKGSIHHHVFGHIIEVEDTAELRLTSNDGLDILYYATTSYAENSEVFLDVVCENAKLRAEEDLTVYWKNGEREIFTEPKASGEKAYWGLTHEILIRDFYRTLAAGEPFMIDAVEGAKSIDIINKVYKSPVMNRCKVYDNM